MYYRKFILLCQIRLILVLYYLSMHTTVLNYRVIVKPDTQTGTKKAGYTALCPTLGVADDGDTIEKALQNVQQAIEAYVESLVADGLPVPTDEPERDIVTTTTVNLRGNIQFA